MTYSPLDKIAHSTYPYNNIKPLCSTNEQPQEKDKDQLNSEYELKKFIESNKKKLIRLLLEKKEAQKNVENAQKTFLQICGMAEYTLNKINEAIRDLANIQAKTKKPTHNKIMAYIKQLSKEELQQILKSKGIK